MEIGEPELTHPPHLYDDAVKDRTSKTIIDKFVQILTAYNNIRDTKIADADKIRQGAQDIYNVEKVLSSFLSSDADRMDPAKV